MTSKRRKVRAVTMREAFMLELRRAWALSYRARQGHKMPLDEAAQMWHGDEGKLFKAGVHYGRIVPVPVRKRGEGK